MYCRRLKNTEPLLASHAINCRQLPRPSSPAINNSVRSAVSLIVGSLHPHG